MRKKHLFGKLHNENAFTLAELLFVVAIIGVLVAISVPVFSSQLEKTREATDLANIRSAYAEVVTGALMGEDTTLTVPLSQTEEDWMIPDAGDTLMLLASGHVDGVPSGTAGDTAQLKWVEEGNTQYVQIIFSGVGGGGIAGGGGTHPRTRGEALKQASDGVVKAFSSIIPGYKLAQADSCFHNGTHGDLGFDFKELSLSENGLDSGAYWDPQKVTWREVLEAAGVDTSALGGATDYIYFDQDRNPIAISYYDENNHYIYTYFGDDPETIELSRCPGDRIQAAYFREYTREQTKYNNF